MHKVFKDTTLAAALFAVGAIGVPVAQAEHVEGHVSIYDESAYTKDVADTMKKLNKLYLEFCGTCGVSGAKANKARHEYLTLSRGLLQKINDHLDSLNPKAGAALSQTEILVTMHALVMLTDILTATELEEEAEHAYNN